MYAIYADQLGWFGGSMGRHIWYTWSVITGNIQSCDHCDHCAIRWDLLASSSSSFLCSPEHLSLSSTVSSSRRNGTFRQVGVTSAVELGICESAGHHRAGTAQDTDRVRCD